MIKEGISDPAKNFKSSNEKPVKAKNPPKPRKLLTYDDGTQLGAVDGELYFKPRGERRWEDEEQARELGITPSSRPQKVEREDSDE